MRTRGRWRNLADLDWEACTPSGETADCSDNSAAGSQRSLNLRNLIVLSVIRSSWTRATRWTNKTLASKGDIARLLGPYIHMRRPLRLVAHKAWTSGIIMFEFAPGGTALLPQVYSSWALKLAAILIVFTCWIVHASWEASESLNVSTKKGQLTISDLTFLRGAVPWNEWLKFKNISKTREIIYKYIWFCF